jgi:hypothetical protein
VYNACLLSKTLFIPSYSPISTTTQLVQHIQSGDITVLLYQDDHVDVEVKAARADDASLIYYRLQTAFNHTAPVYVDEHRHVEYVFNEYLQTGKYVFIGYRNGAIATLARQRADMTVTVVADMEQQYIGYVFAMNCTVCGELDTNIRLSLAHFNAIHEKYVMRDVRYVNRRTHCDCGNAPVTPLPITIMIGPLCLLTFGLSIALVVYTCEIVYEKCKWTFL